MSHPYWVKTELSRHFAALDLDRGVDFDRDGAIDESERTDTNGDGRVDVDEWRSFLKKNEAPLTNLGGFFKSYFTAGQAFAPDNPIHDLLEIESELVSPDLVVSAYRFVEGILKTTDERLSEKEFSSLQKLILPYNVMREVGIEFKDQDDSLLTQNLDEKSSNGKKGILDCDTSSFVAISIAHERGWPIYLVEVPEHVFIRWDDKKHEKFNIDFGNLYTDNFYKERFSISETAIASGVYFKNCDRDGVLSLFLFNRGIARSDLGDLEGSIADYDEAIRLDPKGASAFNNRGISRSDLGDLEGSIADYDEAIRLDPKDASAFNNRGISRSDLRDFKGAIADYDEAIRLDPKDAVAFNRRGVAKYDLGDFKGSIADYDEAIRLDPKDASAFNNRGISRSDLRDFKGAIADYDEAIRLDPKDAVAFNRRGVAKYDLGDFKGAIADYSEVIRFDPKDAVAFNRRGVAKYKLGDFKGAIADYDKAIRLGFTGAFRTSVFKDRAITKLHIGNLSGAIVDWFGRGKLSDETPDWFTEL